ncbi:hypothetical protein ACLK19_16040 [Escherichia coli]
MKRTMLYLLVAVSRSVSAAKYPVLTEVCQRKQGSTSNGLTRWDRRISQQVMPVIPV